jgi:hypothetical protein
MRSTANSAWSYGLACHRNSGSRSGAGFVCGAPVRIRLALFPERHPRDCRYLTRDYLPSEDCHYRREAAQQP